MKTELTKRAEFAESGGNSLSERKGKLSNSKYSLYLKARGDEIHLKFIRKLSYLQFNKRGKIIGRQDRISSLLAQIEVEVALEIRRLRNDLMSVPGLSSVFG